MPDPILKVRDLTVSTPQKRLLNPVDLDIPEGGVFGIIGPSGAGKSTFLKSLNRLTELVQGLRVEGKVWHRGEQIYAPSINPDQLRAKIGMLFQQPIVFPTSIYANVLFGVKHLGTSPKSQWAEVAEKALTCLLYTSPSPRD